MITSSMEIMHADASRRVSFMNRGLNIEECIPRMLSFQGKACNSPLGHYEPSGPVPIGKLSNRLPVNAMTTLLPGYLKCNITHFHAGQTEPPGFPGGLLGPQSTAIGSTNYREAGTGLFCDFATRFVLGVAADFLTGAS